MANEHAIRRDVGAVALMFTGLGSIIGSGWLFGAWRAAQLAGPGAIWAWMIGAVVILFVALTYAELGAMFPESGGMVRYGHYSHGSLVGFVAGVGELDRDRLGDSGGGRSLGAVHELVALAVGAGPAIVHAATAQGELSRHGT